MLLFKTSGATLRSVIANQRHAFLNRPKRWCPGELILVSKNRTDCRAGEKQIQYVMVLDDIRPVRQGEVKEYWPGNEGRWRFIAVCHGAAAVAEPFDLVDALGADGDAYRTVINFATLLPQHEVLVLARLNGSGRRRR